MAINEKLPKNEADIFLSEQAVERLVEPPEVKHERLLVVSILGFLVSSQLYNSVK